MSTTQAAVLPRRRPWVRVLRHIAITALFALVLVLVVRQMQGVDWHGVGKALRAFPPASLAVAALLAAASYALYAAYELVGRYLTRHGLPVRQVLVIGATSYALNLNLGSLVGGIGARLRFYTNAGLDLGQATQVIATSIATNWLGYCALAGTLLAFWPPMLPPNWVLDGEQLRMFGAVLLGVALAYARVCRLLPQRLRQWHWRGQVLTLPSLRVALLQMALAALNWLTMAALVWVALERQIDFTSVATVLLLAAVAGVIVHVPAALGVLEAVFIALLAHELDPARLLAGLIVYRFIYYLVPLALAAGMAVVLERTRAAGTRLAAAAHTLPEPQP
jgi:uncharacterized membrane protein YbhN (UPF0104 family)